MTKRRSDISVGMFDNIPRKFDTSCSKFDTSVRKFDTPCSKSDTLCRKFDTARTVDFVEILNNLLSTADPEWFSRCQTWGDFSMV